MWLEELFVGSVAVVLGVLGIAAAIVNRDSLYEFSKIRWVESWAGRSAARAVYLVVGILLIVLGLVIALGFTRHGSRAASRLSPSTSGGEAAVFRTAAV